jgi:hypothetical protein
LWFLPPAQIEGWKSMNGQQSGDPAKLASALLKVAEQDEPPARFVAGAITARWRPIVLYVVGHTAGRFWIELMRADPATMILGPAQACRPRVWPGSSGKNRIHAAAV